MMQIVLLLFAIVWLGGFALLRIWVARIAAKAGRGDFWDLLPGIGWTIEGNKPWTGLGRLTIAWACTGPFVILGLYLLLFPLMR